MMYEVIADNKCCRGYQQMWRDRPQAVFFVELKIITLPMTGN